MFTPTVPQTVLGWIALVLGILIFIVVTGRILAPKFVDSNMPRLKDLHLDRPMKVAYFHVIGEGILFAFYESEGSSNAFIVNLGKRGRELLVGDVFKVVKGKWGKRSIQLLERKRT